MDRDDIPKKPANMRDLLISGGRANPLAGWVVIGIGIGAAIGAGGNMGLWIGIGAVLGLVIGVAVLRRTGGWTLFGRKDDP